MPRKPKVEKKIVTVVVNGKPVAVTLHPPTASRRSWYAYWVGQTYSRSTGQSDLDQAIKVVEEMIKGSGRRAVVADAVMSDDEFEEIQRVYFGRRRDPAAQVRAQQSLTSCLNAIAAFRKITGLCPVTIATPDDCASFQQRALALPKNWRQAYPKGKEQVECLSPNTVLKWSRSLQAAFERSNRNAVKRRCVRGVVSENKLLSENPWNRFTWIEQKDRAVRQFDGIELLSFLDYLHSTWPEITVAASLAKACLWSAARRREITSLHWDSLRVIGNEYHFAIVGKWGVERWFRIPDGLFSELTALRTESSFVFAAYTDQLRCHYQRGARPWASNLIARDFDPERLGDWFLHRLLAWSTDLPKGRATPHIFRKTALQFARQGEDANYRVACDARVSEAVMMTSYVRERDGELRHASNRTFARILAGMPPLLAARYGHASPDPAELEERLQAAIAAKDWTRVAEVSAEIARQESR